MTAPLDLRLVATQLLELTGLSMAELARRGEVHRPNCLAWLAGKAQVFSEKKQLKVCELLGWRFGRLRRDMIHRWQLGEDLTPLRNALIAIDGEKGETTWHVVSVDDTGAEGAAIILAQSFELPPLVILVRRPLGYGAPTPITASALGLGVDTDAHVPTPQEWQEWWRPESPAGDPSEFLKRFGQALMATVAATGQADAASLIVPAEIDLDMPLSPQMFLGDDPEESQWLSLLAEARNNGLGFEEIVRRTEYALQIKK